MYLHSKINVILSENAKVLKKWNIYIKHKELSLETINKFKINITIILLTQISKKEKSGNLDASKIKTQDMLKIYKCQ